MIHEEIFGSLLDAHDSQLHERDKTHKYTETDRDKSSKAASTNMRVALLVCPNSDAVAVGKSNANVKNKFKCDKIKN